MWRNTGLNPKFFIFDARSFLFLSIFLLRMNKYTLFISCIGIFTFWVLEYVGMKPEVAFRALRTRIFGGIRKGIDVKIFRQRLA